MGLANSRLLPALTLAGGSAIWGLLWLPLRELDESGLGPLGAVALFNLPALLAASAVFAWHRGASRGRVLVVALAGTLAGASISAYCVALIMTSVIRATMLFYLTPVWGTLLGMLWLGERPGPMRFLVLVLGVSGLLLLLGVTRLEDLQGGVGAGDVLGLASGLLWAVAAAVLNRHGDLPVTGVNFFQYLTTAGALGALALLLPAGAAGVPAGGWEPDAIILLHLSASVVILASTYAMLWSLSFLTPGAAGVLMMSEAIVAVVSASILLPEETLSAAEWAGTALVLLAALVEIAVVTPRDGRAAGAARARDPK